jgi:hypothetical protein
MSNLVTELNRIEQNMRDAQCVMWQNVDTKNDAFVQARSRLSSLLKERDSVMRNANPVEKDAYFKAETHKLTPAGRREAGIKF